MWGAHGLTEWELLVAGGRGLKTRFHPINKLGVFKLKSVTNGAATTKISEDAKSDNLMIWI